MLPEALMNRGSEEHEDWSYGIVLAVPDGDSLEDFDTLYDISTMPIHLVCGPVTKAQARAWIPANAPRTDTITYLDRVFAVRQFARRTYLPQRPTIALGLPADRRDGTWYLVKADFPVAAFHHVRRGGGVATCGAGNPLQGCAVEDINEGPWSRISGTLGDMGMDVVPVIEPKVRVPRWHPYPPDVGDD